MMEDLNYYLQLKSYGEKPQLDYSLSKRVLNAYVHELSTLISSNLSSNLPLNLRHAADNLK